MPPRRKRTKTDTEASGSNAIESELNQLEENEVMIKSESESDDESEISDEDETPKEEGQKRELFWSSDLGVMKTFEFTKQPFKMKLPENPYDAFCTLFTDEFLDLIVRETNLAGTKRVSAWKDLTREELLTFLGLLLHTGNIRTNRMTDYWNQHWLFNLTCFSKYMSRVRFLHLLKYISFSSEPVAKKNEANFSTVRPIIDHFNETMKYLVYPDAELLIQESLTVCQDVLTGDFTKSKRGVRLHSLSDTNGVTIKYALTSDTRNISDLLTELLQDHFDSGHKVYIKDSYLTYDIAKKLLERNTLCTAALNEHMTMPPELKLDATSSFYLNNVHIGKWRDFLYITTEFNNESVKLVTTRNKKIIMKPKVVIEYNKALSKLHRSVVSSEKFKSVKKNEEDLMAYYPFENKKMKWDQKVFINVLNQWTINAYLLSSHENKSFYEFRLDILGAILPGETRFKTENLRIPHKLSKIEKIKLRQRVEGGKTVSRREVVRRNCKGCMAKCKRVTTSFECTECEGTPGFCVGCFVVFHS